MVKIKDEFTPDKNGWSRVGLHKWKHLTGFIIQRIWTLGVKKKDIFLCFMTEDDYYKGNNFDSRNHLKDAKNLFK